MMNTFADIFIILRKTVLILVWLNIFLSSLFLSSCEDKTPKKEMWAVVINFISPDTGYYPTLRNFPFPESLQFAPMDSFFVNQGRLPVITDSSIVFYDNYRLNGQKVCCIPDTLQVFMDTINSKKYLFAIGEYIALFQSDSNTYTAARSRKDMPSIPLWGITLNTPYPPEKFEFDHEKLSTSHVKLRSEFDEVTRQKWVDNDSILVETIQFNDSRDLVVTSVYKEMKRDEVDSLVHYIKNNFPSVKYEEIKEKDLEGKELKFIRMYIDGVVLNFTQNSDTGYSFQVTDYYETLKLILKNRQRYVFRDDVSIY